VGTHWLATDDREQQRLISAGGCLEGGWTRRAAQ